MRIRSNNPVYGRIMNSSKYQSLSGDYVAATYGGVARKTMFFLMLVFIGAFGGLWLMQSNPQVFVTALVISLFGTIFFAIIGLLAPSMSKIFGSLYCLGQGMIIGVVSLAFEASAPGIVMTALFSTVIVLAISVTLFMTNIVKVGGKFIRFLLIFGISLIASIFLIMIIDLIFKTGFFSIMIIPIAGLSTFLATLYLFFDFQRIYEIVEGGAPAELEWYVSFGLVYTMIWLYMEILRLLWILRDIFDN